ncbi:MAG: CPBP family intramembrane metalloprotease [Lachnospiraceae bacterium]|nr:CPBP family intramembrane metalloprotease [Lachnospiraceae bacterium]
MKQVKSFGYAIGLVLLLGVIVILSTAALMVAMLASGKGLGIVINEDLLYSMSGSLGIGVAGSLVAIYVKKKNYAGHTQEKNSFQVKSAAYYASWAFSLCSVLFYAITTFLFAHVLSLTEANVSAASIKDIPLFVEVACSICLAPIFEELLFRYGFYNLLRRRLESKSAIFLCTLVFAVIHGYSLQGFCMCLVGGLVFLLIYIRSGNIWYSIIAHMTCNLAATVMNMLEDKGVTILGIPVQYEVSGFNMVHPILIVLTSIYCIVCMVLAKKKEEG